MKKLLNILLLTVFALIIASCKKDNDNESTEPQTYDNLGHYLYNIPISGDTILIDDKYGIDFRVQIAGYKIDTVELKVDEYLHLKYDTNIINTKSFYLTTGIHQIKFNIDAVCLQSGQTVSLNSKTFTLKVVEDLSRRYIAVSDEGGRLNLSWPELDKSNTHHYVIERYMGENLEFRQDFEELDSVYIDNYYVGEKVVYKISVINNEGGKQNIWSYRKEKESPVCSITQDVQNGFNLHYTKCRYYNNFGEYYLTTSENVTSVLLNSTNIADVDYHDASAKFGDEAKYLLRILPRVYPEGVSSANWLLYAHNLDSRFGKKSFEYVGIAKIDVNKVVYTKNGRIYKRNLDTDQVLDSIVGGSASYDFLKATPAGNYFYATNGNLYGSPVYFWSSSSMSNSPLYSLQTSFIIPPVSDNLTAIMSVPSNVVPSKLALYNVSNGANIYTTSYDGSSNIPVISSNGQYFFIDNSGLKLCKYINNTFNIVWAESDWTKYYRFYDFNSINKEICYTWDDAFQFSIKNTADFSTINSYTLNLEKIVNIDYNAGRIMGYGANKIMIYNLSDGALIKEIPANLWELFFYSNKTILIGNTIYSNHGIKYRIITN